MGKMGQGKMGNLSQIVSFFPIFLQFGKGKGKKGLRGGGGGGASSPPKEGGGPGKGLEGQERS